MIDLQRFAERVNVIFIYIICVYILFPVITLQNGNCDLAHRVEG